MALNKESRVFHRGGSSFDEDHPELYIKHITLSIYHLSCQAWCAGAVKMHI